MNQYKQMNRLFLTMVIIYLGGSVLLGLSSFVVGLSEYQLIVLSQILVFFLPCCFCRIKNIHTRELGFCKIRVSTILMSVLCTILIYPLLALINAASSFFVTNETMYMTDLLGNGHLFINLLFVALVPAMIEETVFRGVFFSHYKKGGVLIGAIFSSIVFGCMHLNFNQFAYTFVFGIYLALIVEATGSIFASMACHFTLNGASVLFSSLLLNSKVYETSSSTTDLTASENMGQTLLAMGMLSIIAVATTAGAVGVYIWIYRHSNREEQVKQMLILEKGKRVTPAFMIAFLLCIAYMLYVELAV